MLDYVIYEARRNHVRLILCLVNNLDNFGGKAQYVQWAQAAGVNVTNSMDSFFSHPTIKYYYMEYVKVIVMYETVFFSFLLCYHVYISFIFTAFFFSVYFVNGLMQYNKI
jgi:mannan endo-1,4-beta-mannosidase